MLDDEATEAPQMTFSQSLANLTAHCRFSIEPQTRSASLMWVSRITQMSPDQIADVIKLSHKLNGHCFKVQSVLGGGLLCSKS